MRCKSSSCKKGGSIASDAVTSVVPQIAFDNLNVMFDNKVGGKKIKSSCKSRQCGGDSLSATVNNYDGMLSTEVMRQPSEAVVINKGGSGMRHISSYKSKENYKLNNKVGGVSADPIAIGLQYNAPIQTLSTLAESGYSRTTPITQSYVLGNTIATPYEGAMAKTTSYGTYSDVLPFAFGGKAKKVTKKPIKKPTKKPVKKPTKKMVDATKKPKKKPVAKKSTK